MANRGDQDASELQAVVGRNRLRLIGNPRSMHGSVEPIPASVAGEHPSGAIRPVGGGSKTVDLVSCVRIPKVGHRFAPVVLIGVSPLFLSGDRFAPGH